MVDAVVTAWDAEPPVLGIDATVVCPLLPTYLDAAARSATEIFVRRARDKAQKHKGFSQDDTGTKGFRALVVTHMGGIGPASFWNFWEWFDRAFTSAVG